jgi:DNA-binding MarR family transcriptional regulator
MKEQLIKAMLSSKKVLMIITAKAGVPFAEIMILMHIHHLADIESTDDGVRVTCIKDQTHISLPAVSQQLRTLEHKGLIERKTKAKDRRITLVTLTPAGCALLAKVMEQRDLLLEKLVLEVGEKNIRKYIETSIKIIHCLTDSDSQTEQCMGSKFH